MITAQGFNSAGELKVHTTGSASFVAEIIQLNPGLCWIIEQTQLERKAA